MSEPVVRVAGLTKVFRSYRRHEGLAAAVKEIVNRFDVADLSIEEPQIEEVVKRIYRGGDRVGEVPLRRRDDFQETSVE